MKNKKILILIFIVIIVGVILFLYFNNKKNNISFLLNGPENVYVEYGKEYEELGFIAKDGYGNNIENNVTVTGNVNSLVSGVYLINYELNYNNKKINLTRKVTVNDVKVSDLKIVLNGKDNIYVLKGDKYNEEGAYVLNTLTEEEFNYGKLTISGDVDVNTIGTYEVIYNFTYNNEETSITRKVVVIDINYSLSEENITPGKVTIKLNLDNVTDYLKTILPNNEEKQTKEIEYEVSSNGEYTFKVVLSNNQVFEKKVKIDNIISNYTCSGTITRNGTTISVTPTNDIREYEWIIGNEKIKGTNTYSKYRIINSAKVNLIFNNGKSYQINCNITDKLVYHFKYDENNTKPFMKCDTYTAEDKVKYETMLKQAVAEAGYGTRAGVVEAARFLVGALDYKVPYHGSSKYSKVGLNIGQKGAWGCSNSGLDCYYFVYWAISQNGLPLGALYGGTKYDTINEIDKIKVGDYLLAPCNTATCKNEYRINHIALVIGIDDKYIYVAEETTSTINALVVTKVDKSNVKKSGLTKVRHIDYPSEGNVTNMWLSE